MTYGTVNADVITTSTAGGVLGAGNASIMKNRLINGSMVIDQRNAGASVTAGTGTYTLDRWLGLNSVGSKYTVQQNAGSVTPPAGFTNYLGVTSSSAYSVSSGDYLGIVQRVEGYNMADLGWGTANAKTVTLSFWVRSSLTGTFGGSLTNSAEAYSYPYSYTISSANTWEQKTVTITGATSGTWLATNGTGIELWFSLGTGSTFSGTAGAWASTAYFAPTGATSVVGTNGATFYITGVQLEVGSSATGFEYVNYQTSLANCQRYYAKISGGGFSNYCGFAAGFVAATTQLEAVVKYPVTMRASATLNYSNVRTNTAAGTNAAITSILASYAGTDSINATFNSTSSSMTAGQGGSIVGNNNSAAYLELSAEL